MGNANSIRAGFRVEANSDLFELVATLAGGELSILIDRFATNEPVLQAQVEVESGALKALAKFHADIGYYAVDDPAMLKKLSTPGEHPLVITVLANKMARTVWALFAEARTYLLDTLEAQVALRHEHNGAGFASTNPKIALLYRPADAVSLRGSFTTAFRAPSVFQTSSAETVLQNIVDPVTQTTSYRGIRTLGSRTLAPETARIFNLGATIAPFAALNLSVDAWRFDYRNIIVKQNAQAIVLANPSDPRIVRQSGQILRIDSAFTNAASALTDGLDLSARYVLGEVTVTGEATYIRRFLIKDTPTAVAYDAAGNRNYNTFARSLPKWRGQVGASWTHGPSTLSATVRMVGRYRDDQNGNAAIPGQATLDAQYTFRFAPRWGLKEGPAISLGALNLTDRDPPPINTNAGYDSKVFDPRGRVIYLRVQAGW